jgi:hypothetical protein
MTGYWMSRETAFSRDTVIGAVQSTSAWALYRFSQSGDVFQVEEHLACGNHSSGSASIDPTSGALRGFLAHNHQDTTGLHGPRKGTFKPLSGACSFSFDRWYEIHGATEDLLPADFSLHPDLGSLAKLPSESDPVHPTKQSLTGAIDFDGDGTLGFGALVTGVDETGAPLTATATSTRPTLAQSQAVQAGINEVLLNGNLRGKPTIIVHGRSDTLIPVNFSSRPYVLRNSQVEGASSRLRYVEVTNGQHFDSFLGFAGYDSRYVPLHLYYIRAMDAMWATLKNGTPLPA